MKERRYTPKEKCHKNPKINKMINDLNDTVKLQKDYWEYEKQKEPLSIKRDLY